MKASQHINNGGEVNSVVGTRLFGERMNNLSSKQRSRVRREISAMVKAGLPITIHDCAEMAMAQ